MLTEPLHEIDQPSLVPAEPLGWVLSVNGSQASVRLQAPGRAQAGEARVSVGKFLGIRTDQSLVIGVLTKISAETDLMGTPHGEHATGQLDLVEELRNDERNVLRFDRGVKEYPTIGDPADLIGHRELEAVFGGASTDTIDIGHLQQDRTIGAYVKIDDMVSKHFAVFGTTGVGKSSGVALILQRFSPPGRTSASFLSIRTTNMAAASATARRSSIRRTSSCRSGCSTSKRRSTCSSAAAPAWRKRSRFFRS
jgi:Helicase HerA, central domain